MIWFGSNVVSSLFGAGLSRKSQSDVVTLWLTQLNLNLFDGVGGVLELSQVEALLFLDVLADDLGDFNVLGYAFLNWIWCSNVDLDLIWDGHNWDLV